MPAEVNTLMDSIENLEFVASVTVASTPEGFKYALNLQPEFRELSFLAASDSETRSRLFERIRYLANLEVDVRYSNPFDVPIATYVSSLSYSHKPEALLAAQAALDARNIWRASHIAAEVLESPPLKNATETTTVSIGDPQEQATFEQETMERLFVPRRITESDDVLTHAEYALEDAHAPMIEL
jgi:hypothetical protein